MNCMTYREHHEEPELREPECPECYSDDLIFTHYGKTVCRNCWYRGYSDEF